MEILLYLGLAAAAFVAASRFYGRWIAGQLGEDADHPTPACTVNDGNDFVPTRPHVLFAHHFATIAGAGPIVGPTMAIVYGFAPAWLWVVLGGIFIGAVHDFTALFVTMREGGRSMAEVARKTLGPAGFTLFILFTLIMLLLVTSAFLNMIAMSLTSLWPLAKLGLSPDQTLLHTVTENGVVLGRIGGIASTSVVIITAFSPLLGWLMYKKNISARLAYALAGAVCVGSIITGVLHPVVLSAPVWMAVISVYVFIAAGIPVWLILQPRDFINVQILYAGLGLLVVGLVAAGLAGTPLTMPTMNVAEGVQQLGLIWPVMFITIACGAVSGFHCLVAGGTTAKQLAGECDARRIGFNAMLLESLLAVCVLLTLAAGLVFDDYKLIVYPREAGSNPVLAFSLAAGHLLSRSLGIPADLGTVFGVLMVEGFVVTTLDSAVRLNRYLFEELWAIVFEHPPWPTKSYWFNSGLSVVLMWALAYGNAFKLLWPIFGASNQLLAALALITIAMWLILKGRKFIFALLPALFMLVTTVATLFILMENYWKEKKYVLIGADLTLLGLTAALVILMIVKLKRRGRDPGPDDSRPLS